MNNFKRIIKIVNTLYEEEIDFNKLVSKYSDISKDIAQNKYFYKDEYEQYQSGNYGYDLDLPKDKFNSTELMTIRNLIYPTLNKLGYVSKIIGKRNQERVYLLILFKNNSRLPNFDNRRNPVVYPIPFELFQDMKDDSSTNGILTELIKYYNLS